MATSAIDSTMDRTNETKQGYTYGGKNYSYEQRFDANNNPYQVAVEKGSAPSPTAQYSPRVSTTTISNENKLNQIPSLNQQLTQYSTRGQTTDGENVINPDGSLAPKREVPQGSTPIYSGYDITGYQTPDALTGGLTSTYFNQVPDYMTSVEDQASYKLLDEMKTRSDAVTSQQIQNIQKKFDVLRAQQAQVNKAQEGATRNALLTGGVTGKGSSAQYAPISSEGIMSARLNYSIQQIAELDAKESDLIVEAENAKLSNDWKIVEQKLGMIEKAKAEKAKKMEEVNKAIIEEQKKTRERQIQASRDYAVSELYSSGLTSPSEILKYLNENGGDVTLKEVNDAIKNIAPGIDEVNKIVAEVAKNGAPLSVIQQVGMARTPLEATMAAGSYIRDPLETEYKIAQIEKMRADMEAQGISGEQAPQLIAYAQQYASTGAIPTGLPKGSFGVVSQLAKELPKQKGQIVATATGVVPQKDSEYASGLASMASVADMARQLKELDRERIGGVVSGTLGKIFGSEDQQNYVDLREQIIDLLSRARSGAALTVNEERRYKDMLPGRLSEPLGIGADSDVRIDNFIEAIETDLRNKSAAKGWSVYGYSKVNIGGQDYTVGDIIDNGAQKGRVNPDGSITILEGEKQSFNQVGGDTNLAIQIPQSSRLAYVNNNPGNLRFAGQQGATQGEGGFARFPSPEAGLKALYNQIKLDASRGLTLEKFINKYAPPSENNTVQYLAQVMKMLGAKANDLLTSLDLDKLAQAIALKESSTKIS